MSVSIVIGSDSREYTVDGLALIDASEFFADAIGNDLEIEGKETRYTFRDISVAAFKLFTKWLYDSRLPSMMEFGQWASIFELSGKYNLLSIGRYLIEAYQLADRFIATSFRHSVNAKLVEAIDMFNDKFPLMQLSRFAFQSNSSIPADRPILQCMLDKYSVLAWTGGDDMMEEDYFDGTYDMGGWPDRVRGAEQYADRHETEKQYRSRCYVEHGDEYNGQQRCGYGPRGKVHMTFDGEHGRFPRKD